ncbi:helix-turn-helix transcriptional regulator [Pelagibius sp. CAU 1746]|uniref:helix-turn-helix domain-containing protein n=1 Tax=Pelagibius sp. CAU 1746 TaxID=3140370 RepID=UPI00325A8941
MRTDFIANLRLLCSYHASTSEVCRKIGISRQQFTKYLSGSSFPSQRNLRVLCDFFGVEDYELLMPSDQFANIVRLRPVRGDDGPRLPPRFERLIGTAARHANQLRRFHGYYFKYFYSLSEPGMVLRSLVYIYSSENLTQYKTIERLRPFGSRASTPYIFKYDGILLLVGDRLHMIDHEVVVGNEVSQSILYLPNRNRLSQLFGLMIGVAGTEAHQPAAVKVVLEYLGKTVDRKRALAHCGLLDPAHASIDPQICEYIAMPQGLEADALRCEVPTSMLS